MIQRISKGHSKVSGQRKTGFTYKPRSERAMKERAEQTGGRFDSPFKGNFDVFRPKVGDNLIRILPPTWDEADHYGLDIWVHGFVGADNGSYLCLAKMQNKSCPICKAAKECRDAGETDEAKALEPKKQVLTWIIDRDDDNQLPQLYAMSWTMDRDIAALCYNKRTGKILSIDHPDEGYDVTIKRQGQGLKTRYFGIQIDRDPSPIADDDKDRDKIMDFIQENPLSDVLKFYDVSHLQKVMEGATDQPDEDAESEEEVEPETEEEQEEYEAKAHKKATRRRDEDEEEESEEEPDEGEEEEPSRRPTTKSRRGRDEDEELEEEESEPDEEDEPEEESEEESEEEPDEDEEEERPRHKAKIKKKAGRR